MAEPAGWVLSVDLGTSYSLAAWWRQGRSVEVLDIGGERRVPSVVYVDDQRTVVGRIAEDLATADPSRALRTPKRRLGDPAPAVLGGRAHDVGDLVAALFAHIYNEAVRHHGSAPEVVRLTHPAAWGGARRQALVDAANRAGITNTHLVAEPVAAAVSYAAETTMNHGDRVLVYDLGGGTFDTAALESTPEGFVVIGRPGGDQTVGGELFDELLVNEIGERLDPATWDELQVSDDPTWRQTAARLRAEARRAKEALSSYPWVDVLVPLPSGIVQQRLTQADLRAIIEPHIADTVDILTETAAMAGLTENDIDAVYLVGGASRTPLVPELVSAAFANTTVSQRGDPKAAVATGAAHPNAAHGRIGHRRSVDHDQSGTAGVAGAAGLASAPGGGAPPPVVGPTDPPRPAPAGGGPPSFGGPTAPPGGGPGTGADPTAPPAAHHGYGAAAPPLPGATGTGPPPPGGGRPGGNDNGNNTAWVVATIGAAALVVLAGALVVVALVLRSDDDERADGDPTSTLPPSTTETTAPEVTTTGPAPTTVPTTTAPGGPDLDAALITIGDLPASGSWSQVPVEEDTLLCDAVPTYQPEDTAEIAFNDLFAGDGVYESIERYADPTTAQAALDEAVQAIRDCPVDTVTIGGLDYNATAAAISATEAGLTPPPNCDMAVTTIQLTDSSGFATIHVATIGTRCNDVIIALQVAGADPNQFDAQNQALAQTALVRAAPLLTG
ncbi:MAG: Hsp70 family protein [Actinomycetota bacterium]|nr:Hsp70 family protein [Actinomycetota bacterium]